MNTPKSAYFQDLDQLMADTPLDSVLAPFGFPPPEKTTGEHRMPCVFNSGCADSSYGTLTVKLDDPIKRIFCHTCGVRGNLLTLLWGLSHQQPPTGGKLRGEEFKESVALLRSLHGGPPPPAPQPTQDIADAKPPEETKVPEVNLPLKDSENERARQLVTLHEQLVVDVESMHPAAASYFRQRPWLTPEVARQWRMGYLSQSAKGLLRGRIVYAYSDEQNDVLSYFGRDPAYHAKQEAWVKKGRPETGQPIKHRFVKGFHRGLELYGQHGSERLKDRRLKESLSTVGLVVCEGPNDVIRLDTLGVAAVGLCSNKATQEQVTKIAEFAKQTAGGKVLLLPDCDPEGEDGFKELIWKLHQQAGLRPKLGWSSGQFGGQFQNRQPESLSIEEWNFIAETLS